MPVLAVVGSQDPLKARVDALKASLVSLKVVVINDADHMTAPGKPEFAQSVREFISAHPNGRSEGSR